MKGKKLMAMLMAGSLLLAGLTGCGGGTAKGSDAAAGAAVTAFPPVRAPSRWYHGSRRSRTGYNG